MAHAKTYRVETDRLTIRCYTPADAQLLLNAIEASREHLGAWMPWAHGEHFFEDKVELLRRFRGEFDMGVHYNFGIFNKAGTELIGSIGWMSRVGEGAWEIGYWIGKNHANQGLALEASAALTKVAFEVEAINRVEIHCAPENTYSQRIPAKLGFNLDGVLRQRTVDGSGAEKDRMIWTMFKNEYLNSPAKNVQVQAYDVLDRPIITEQI